jgi:transcriptional regulator NrdR family protein
MELMEHSSLSFDATGDLPAFKQRQVHIQSALHTMTSVAQNLRSFMSDEILTKDNVNYPVWLLKQKEQITYIKNQLLQSIGITINK